MASERVTIFAPMPTYARAPRRRRGMTLVELLIAILILAMLGWALAQLLASGMATWREGQTRRGAYERAQYIFERLVRDLAALYPHNPPMPDAWVFQADTLFSPDYDGAGNDAVAFTSDNISLVEAGGVRYLTASNASAEAWVEYRFAPMVVVETAVVQPKFRLFRSSDAARTCRLIVEAAKEGGGFRPIVEFSSGGRDQVMTPSIDIRSDVLGAAEVIVRLRITPEPGKQSDIRLFEASAADTIRPVFRFAASARSCQTAIGLVSDYIEGVPDQFLTFVRSTRTGLQEVAYRTMGGELCRSERPGVGSPASLLDVRPWVPIAKGIVYFGCEFPNAAGAPQLYWREADSVPPYITATVSAVPLSGPKMSARLRADVSAAATIIPVDSTRPFPEGNSANQFIRIGDEWIRYGGLEKGRFTGCVRGERGTVPAPHSAGAEVLGAETFRLNIPVPAWGYRSR